MILLQSGTVMALELNAPKCDKLGSIAEQTSELCASELCVNNEIERNCTRLFATVVRYAIIDLLLTGCAQL